MTSTIVAGLIGTIVGCALGLGLSHIVDKIMLDRLYRKLEKQIEKGSPDR